MSTIHWNFSVLLLLFTESCYFLLIVYVLFSYYKSIWWWLHITTSIGVKLSILWLVGSSLLSLSWWRPLACHLPIFQIHLQSTPKWKSIAVKDIVINFYLRRGINKEDAISFCCIWYIFFRHKYNLIYAFNVLFNYKIMCNN